MGAWGREWVGDACMSLEYRNVAINEEFSLHAASLYGVQVVKSHIIPINQALFSTSLLVPAHPTETKTPQSHAGRSTILCGRST